MFKFKSKLIIAVMIIFGITAFMSCEKVDEVIEPDNKLVVDPTVNVVDGHLRFENSGSFNNLLEQMHEFGKSSLDKEFYDDMERQGFRGLNKGLFTRLKSGSLETVEDTLVLDPYFAALLNDEREIEVNGVLYKITEHGTFITAPSRLDELNVIIDDYTSNNKSIKTLKPIEENMYEIENGIYVYDSQRMIEPIEDIYDDEYGGGSGGSSGGSGGSSGGSTTSTNPYENISWHNFDAHTWVGTAFQALFGRTKAYTRKFSSKRRIKVNFYSVDFKIYSGIGLNVKYQKKNWIGWSKTECKELTWGWEGVEYYYKFDYSYPSGIQTPVRKEYSGVPAVKNKKALTVNFLDYELDVPYEDGLKAAIKLLYKKSEEWLAPNAKELRDASLVQFREVFPDKVKVVVAPFHETKYNVESFSKSFDYGTCQISLTFGNGSGFWDIVGLANTSPDFDVKKIRVYGIAKYYDTYKGIGIKKDAK
ncbi:MAG: hypothetical protein U9R54_04585 [Bacteroidota bacterium]|nr:hypothetical protein [Bacteroidota bacterium]